MLTRLSRYFYCAAALLLGVSLFAQERANEATNSFSFRTDILPILTKAGCNAGACHGAAPGAGGFKLSLLGYDPEEDYERITRELTGRRIDLDLPGSSLFLRKPTGQMDHEGGRKIARSSDEYRALLLWIENGAPLGAPDLKVERITVSPEDHLFQIADSTTQIKVTAYLSNGEKQDATSLALFNSNDDGIAEVDKRGVAKIVSAGATSIMVRYGGQVAAVRVAMPFPPSSKPLISLNSPTNLVDRYIAAEWNRLRLPPAGRSSDAEFLRRVSLDLTGRLPKKSLAGTIAKGHPLNREELIDELLKSEAFTDLWTMHLADLLQIGGKKSNAEAAKVYHHWLRGEVAANRPLNQIAAELLTAKGKLDEHGPANFFTLAADPRDTAEHVSRIFMGTQLACARCHAHPTDRWTQDDYYGFAAFFAGVAQDAGAIGLNDKRALDHPKSHLPVAAKPLGAPAFRKLSSDPRTELSEWLTSKENGYFAKNFVNRVWKLLMGRGLVEPVDDLRPTNPATHPQLLDALAAQFAGDGDDLRKLVRTIVSSQSYQLTSTPPLSRVKDPQFYSHAYVKELPASVLLDAISDVTGEFESFENYPAGARAVQLVGSSDDSYALDVLGRCQREKPCSSANQSGGGLAQALHLLNGTTINSKLNGPVLRGLIAEKSQPSDIIEELYLASLSRLPSIEEASYWQNFFTTAANKTEAVQDMCWALLNSREFTFNH